MQRLGKNKGRYHGEGIDIDALQLQIHQLAEASGWRCDTFLEIPQITLRGYHRQFPGAKFNLYVGTGIHGDEPSGPLAIRQLLEENLWPQVNIWLTPCLNPTGFRLNTRENAYGIDLNRDYRHLNTPEIKAHSGWLKAQPQFDLSLLLHEDWEANGFYIYELNPENRPSLAGSIIEAVRLLCPIESAERVDNFVCSGGIIRPNVKPEERPQWAEAIYLIAHKSRQSYTLETPSDFPLEFRVEAHLQAVHETFRHFRSGS